MVAVPPIGLLLVASGCRYSGRRFKRFDCSTPGTGQPSAMLDVCRIGRRAL